RFVELPVHEWNDEPLRLDVLDLEIAFLKRVHVLLVDLVEVEVVAAQTRHGRRVVQNDQRDESFTCGCTGATLQLVRGHAAPWLAVGPYLALGWTTVVVVRQLFDRLGVAGFRLLAT